MSNGGARISGNGTAANPFNISGAVGSDGSIWNVVRLSQADYNLIISKSSTTLYLIV